MIEQLDRVGRGLDVVEADEVRLAARQQLARLEQRYADGMPHYLRSSEIADIMVTLRRVAAVLA